MHETKCEKRQKNKLQIAINLEIVESKVSNAKRGSIFLAGCQIRMAIVPL